MLCKRVNVLCLLAASLAWLAPTDARAQALVRLLDGWRAALALGLLLFVVVAGSLYVFTRHFVMPPLVPMLTGLFTVVPLLLLDNSVRASRDLDDKLERLARIQKRFLPRRATM